MKNYFDFRSRGSGDVILHLAISYLELGGHIVRWSGTVWAIFAKGIMRNISVKLF